LVIGLISNSGFSCFMGKRILVGESNYAEFEVLNDLLTAKGFQVKWLKNGRDVVDQFSEASPDLMILDALLPGMTGLKITRAIKALPEGRDVKIILMSSVYKQFEQQYQARAKLGVDAYTQKPVNVGELERLINDLVGEGVTPEREEAEEAPEKTVDVEETAAPSLDRRKRIGEEGELSETSFPKLLFLLHKYQRTGALRVDRKQVSKMIFFQSGLPVLVTSNQSTESLGRFLTQNRFITTAQYNSSLERMLQTGRQHGEILLEMGAITPHDLYRGIYDHVVEKVLSVFSWDQGRYQFKPGRFEINEDFSININPIHLIFDGVKRFFPLSRLEGFFNEYKNKRLICDPHPTVSDGTIGFGPQAMKFVTLVNGRRTVGQIVARSNLTLTETFQLLYVLLLVESIRFRGDPFFGERGLKAQVEYLRDRRERRREMRDTAEETEPGDRLAVFANDVRAALEGSRSLNHYELLSIPRDADINQIKAAYFHLSTRYHDHVRYAKAAEETKAASEGVFQALTKAYVALIDPDQRRQYDHELAKETIPDIAEVATPDGAVELFEEPDQFPFDEPSAVGPPGAEAEAPAAEAEAPGGEDVALPEPVEKPAEAASEELEGLDSLWDEKKAPVPGEKDEIFDLSLEEDEAQLEGMEKAQEVTSGMAALLKAELVFQDGEDALRREDFPAALKAFKEALDVTPNEAEYHGFLGWAMFRSDPGDSGNVLEARRMIEKGLAMNPSLDSAHFFLGMIALDRGEKEEARGHFEKSLQSNPGNEEASEALGKLEEG